MIRPIDAIVAMSSTNHREHHGTNESYLTALLLPSRTAPVGFGLPSYKLRFGEAGDNSFRTELTLHPCNHYCLEEPLIRRD